MIKKNIFTQFIGNPRNLVRYSGQMHELNDGTTGFRFDVTIKDGKYLSDVFSQLPSGIIDKKVTGIGGTTLELETKRNSIIVEPLRAIASSKAAKKQEEYLYVGSPCGIYNKRVSRKKIEEYVLNQNIDNKKILVVADSLPNLMEVLVETLGESVYSDYFILIDEIDSFQGDSTFRDAMELCMDIYKHFPYSNRAMISATILELSDPDLIKESFTTINYPKPIGRKINLIHTNSLRATIAEEIHEILKRYPDDKIVIAYNILDEALVIIKDLENTFNIPKTKIKMLCSNSNFETAGIYFGEVLNENLPASINFLTSAYFTGVDINENYHSISVCNVNILHTLLSDHKLKQIAGRCRKGLLSETVIFNTFKVLESSKVKTLEDLKSIAESHLAGMRCFNVQYENNPLLKQSLLKIQENLIKISNYWGYNLVRLDINNNQVISYFNMDAFLENQRVKEQLYADKFQLLEVLRKQNHEVNFMEKTSDRDLFEKNNLESEQNKERLIEDALDDLRNIDGEYDKLDKLISKTKSSSIKEKVYIIYQELLNFVDHETALSKTEKFSKQRDSKEFSYFKHALLFAQLGENDRFKKAIYNSFPIGETFTGINIQKTLAEVYSGFFMAVEGINTPINAVRMLKCYLDIKAKRSGGHNIIGKNPKKLDPTSISYVNGKRYINFDNVKLAE